jgi:alkanesulfonate monooxygenase SsuD/methylene tetrahydromethanopterin reductase-like flavin-dependent oxidoreductase (luciferase family)
MPDYGHEIEFGVSIDPSASLLPITSKIAVEAEALGFDLIGIQDHPYQWRFLDTWMLMAAIIARTTRIRVFPDVTNLPLRGPAMIAKQAASLDVLSGGRFELGLGAGGFWDAIAAMGGPRRTPGEALEALQEAIQILRLFWSGERTIAFSGRIYSVKGLHPGPAPAHPISIWVGAVRPRALRLIGRMADGWIPSLSYVPPAQVPEAQRTIDGAASAAGRDPAQIRRIYNLMGTITDGPARGLLQGPPDHWIDALTSFVVELGFETFIFWPGEDPHRQIERFASEVAPGVRAAVAAKR